MKKYLLFIFLLLTMNLADTFSQPFCLATDDTLNLSSLMGAISQTNDGGYILAGSIHQVTGTLYDGYLLRLNSVGNIQWTKRIEFINTSMGFNSILQLSDNSYVVGGIIAPSSNPTNYDFLILKFDSLGSIVWHNSVGGALADIAYSMVQSNDGGFVIAGSTKSFGSGNNDAYVIKFNSVGVLQWTKVIGDADEQIIRSIVKSPDGGYALAGINGIYGINSKFYVIKMSDVGNVQWISNITLNSIPGWGSAHKILNGSNGRFIVGGNYDRGGGFNDVLIVKIDSAGSPLSSVKYDDAASEFDGVFSMTQINNNRYVIGDYFKIYLTDSIGSILSIRKPTNNFDQISMGGCVKQMTEELFKVAEFNIILLKILMPIF